MNAFIFLVTMASFFIISLTDWEILSSVKGCFSLRFKSSTFSFMFKSFFNSPANL